MSIQIKDATGATKNVATKLVGTDHFQQQVPYEQNRSDTFTGAGAGTAVDVSLVPCSRFAIQVKGTGAVPTAWEVVLEVSLNGTDYTAILTHKNGNHADGAVLLLATAAPVKFFRSRCVSLTLGGATNIVTTIIGEAA